MFWADYVNTASLPGATSRITSNACRQPANLAMGHSTNVSSSAPTAAADHNLADRERGSLTY
jgi:hypothetical protein